MANILVIDDIDFIRKAIRKILKDQGHTIYEAENGEEALKVIETTNIDIMLLDIVMPKKGGAETLMSLYKKHKNLKVIAMTGKVSKDSIAFKNILNQFGVETILFKPFSKKLLISTIDKLIA